MILIFSIDELIQKIGTPEEDAFRRDLTINALFYNLNTNEVEDFTQKVKSDLSLTNKYLGHRRSQKWHNSYTN